MLQNEKEKKLASLLRPLRLQRSLSFIYLFQINAHHFPIQRTIFIVASDYWILRAFWVASFGDKPFVESPSWSDRRECTKSATCHIPRPRTVLLLNIVASLWFVSAWACFCDHLIAFTWFLFSLGSLSSPQSSANLACRSCATLACALVGSSLCEPPCRRNIFQRPSSYQRHLENDLFLGRPNRFILMVFLPPPSISRPHKNQEIEKTLKGSEKFRNE